MNCTDIRFHKSCKDFRLVKKTDDNFYMSRRDYPLIKSSVINQVGLSLQDMLCCCRIRCYQALVPMGQKKNKL